jgi:hypothetical protein
VNLPECGAPAERLDIALREVLTLSRADILTQLARKVA